MNNTMGIIMGKQMKKEAIQLQMVRIIQFQWISILKKSIIRALRKY